MSDDPRPVHHYWFHGFVIGFVLACAMWGLFEIGRWAA